MKNGKPKKSGIFWLGENAETAEVIKLEAEKIFYCGSSNTISLSETKDEHWLGGVDMVRMKVYDSEVAFAFLREHILR